jgi:lysophospholipase L1-like esterase
MRFSHRIISTSLVFLPLLAMATTPSPPTSQWQTTWISPAQPVWDERFLLPLGIPRTLGDVTLRQTVRTSLGGSRFRVVVSNEYGTEPLRVGRLTVRLEGGGPAKVLRFQGDAAVVVPIGARMASDSLLLAAQAGDRLELDLEFPAPTGLAGFHWDARERALLMPGVSGHLPASMEAQSVDVRAFITEVHVEADRAPTTIVAIGDSLTDGNGSSPGLDQRWPDHLARRMAPHAVAVLNAGISGNRLLRSGMGDSALDRFERDVLRHPGVRAVIVLLGTNDIGWPGGPFAPAESLPTVQALVRGFQQLADQAHGRRIRLIAATLPPFEDALKGTPLEGHYSAQKEALRQALNRWIRESNAFDSVVDFDAVLRDPSHPTRLRAEFDSGDHLHPGDAGYRAMAEAIDLKALQGTAATETRP